MTFRVDFGTSLYFTLFAAILFALPALYTKLPLKIVIFRAFIHLNTPWGYLPSDSSRRLRVISAFCLRFPLTPLSQAASGDS